LHSVVRLLLLALLCLLAGAAAPAAAAADAPARILLQPRSGLDADERAALRSDAGVQLERRLSLAGVEVVQAAPGERADALAALRHDPEVLWAEPERPRFASTADAYFGYLWALPAIRAPEAWASTRGAGATVAVVDSGVDLSHPELVERLVPGWDYVDGDATPQDMNGHGTHVAGTVAATENSADVVGVAPAASVQPLRVLDGSGRGSTLTVTRAFDAAGDAGVRVVSASLGSASPSRAEELAIRHHPGTLFVVAAGNDGANVDVAPEYPCAYDAPNVLCVGASMPDDAPAPFSNHGAVGVDLFAPGTDILSTRLGGGSVFSQGTSMATPHVSGAAALLFALHPEWSAAQVKQALMDGAQPVPALAGRAVTGGRLDVAGALGVPAPAPDEPPAAPAATSATAGDGAVALDWPDSPEADLAHYVVYRVGASGPQLVGLPAGSAYIARGLVNDQPYAFRVAAVDRAGNVSPLGPTATATPHAVPATADAPRSTPPAAPADTPAVTAPPALSGLALRGRVRACTGCRSGARLRFRLSAEAWVRVRLEQRVCRRGRCTWRSRGRSDVQLPAGTQSWPVGPRLAGLVLRRGTWRVTLSTTGGSARLRFAVARR
jgi:subtilisin family serine protease